MIGCAADAKKTNATRLIYASIIFLIVKIMNVVSLYGAACALSAQ
jgi:hypothetical protein